MAQITLNSTGVASSGALVLQSNGTTVAVTIDTSQRAAFVAGTAALPAITTSGDTDTGIFFPAANTIAFSEGGAEAMRIDSSGNVGIGTISPNAKLDVAGNAIISVTDNTNAALRITQLGTSNALLVEDSTNPDASPFVIDAAGRVINGYTESLSIGIGGDVKMQLTGAAGTSGLTMARFDNNATGARFQFLKSRNATPGSSTIVQNGDSLGTIAWYGDDGAADYASNGGILAAFIGANVDGTPGTNDMPGRLTFNTTADGASTTTERMRIDSAGYLQQLTAPILPYQGAPASKAAAATLTGAELVTGILNTTGTTYTITLPTGTNIEGALSWASNNVCLDWWVINTATGIITIGANGNTTLGGLTIATGVSAHFRIRRTATNTFTIYRLS